MDPILVQLPGQEQHSVCPLLESSLYLIYNYALTYLRQAKLNTFERDLGLKDDNFNTAVSILNVGLVFLQHSYYFSYHG